MAVVSTTLLVTGIYDTDGLGDLWGIKSSKIAHVLKWKSSLKYKQLIFSSGDKID